MVSKICEYWSRTAVWIDNHLTLSERTSQCCDHTSHCSPYFLILAIPLLLPMPLTTLLSLRSAYSGCCVDRDRTYTYDQVLGKVRTSDGLDVGEIYTTRRESYCKCSDITAAMLWMFVVSTAAMQWLCVVGLISTM